MAGKNEKILVCGDLHTKCDVFDYVKSLAVKYDKVIFLGDYVDDWNAVPEASENLLNRLVEYKKAEPNKVILLWGNHDLSEFYGQEFLCAGYNPRTNQLVSNIFEKNLCFFEVAYAWNGVLFTHAGLTKEFAKQIKVDDLEYKSASIIAAELNGMMVDWSNTVKLAQTGPARGGVSVPSPLWADKEELLADCPENLKQIVGHTPVEGISEYNISDSTIIFCDTFSTNSDLEPIGDGGLLEIEYDDGQLNYCAVQTIKYKMELI